MQVNVPVLEGALVRLEPLAVRHAADLAAAAEEDRGSYRFTLVPRGPEIGGYLDAQFARTAAGAHPVRPGPAGRRPRRGVHRVLGPAFLARPR